MQVDVPKIFGRLLFTERIDIWRSADYAAEERSCVDRGGRVIYMSPPKYIGDDRLVFAREGTDPMYRPITWTIEMNVQVKERL